MSMADPDESIGSEPGAVRDDEPQPQGGGTMADLHVLPRGAAPCARAPGAVC